MARQKWFENVGLPPSHTAAVEELRVIRTSIDNTKLAELVPDFGERNLLLFGCDYLDCEFYLISHGDAVRAYFDCCRGASALVGFRGWSYGGRAAAARLRAATPGQREQEPGADRTQDADAACWTQFFPGAVQLFNVLFRQRESPVEGTALRGARAGRASSSL